jgi:hypothetical protein
MAFFQPISKLWQDFCNQDNRFSYAFNAIMIILSNSDIGMKKRQDEEKRRNG